MHILENQMIETLIDLRENHHVVGLKLSFEDEGTLADEATVFMRIAQKVSLPVAIKVGGCDARKDIYDAWNLGVSKIVAPMVETPYALKLFIQALNSVCPNWQESGIKAYINVETITACQNIEAILAIPEAKQLAGCVMGRTDLVGSMNLSRDLVNSDTVFNTVSRLSQFIKNANKEFLIGGSMTIDSIPFIQKLPTGSLQFFETRNVIFDISSIDNDVQSGLNKAMSFEIDWLKFKQNKYTALATKNEQRRQMLEALYIQNIA